MYWCLKQRCRKFWTLVNLGGKDAYIGKLEVSFVECHLGHVSYLDTCLSKHDYLFWLRWLSSPTSLLYDPALCRMVQRMMKKLFMQVDFELCHFIF